MHSMPMFHVEAIFCLHCTLDKMSYTMLKKEVSFSLCNYQPWYKNLNNRLESLFWKLSVDSLSCSSVYFPLFPFLQQVFPLPLATLLIIVSSSLTLHWAIEIKKKKEKEKKKEVSRMGFFSWEILIHLHRRQEVPLSHWFAVSGGEIIS